MAAHDDYPGKVGDDWAHPLELDPPQRTSDFVAADPLFDLDDAAHKELLRPFGGSMPKHAEFVQEAFLRALDGRRRRFRFQPIKDFVWDIVNMLRATERKNATKETKGYHRRKDGQIIRLGINLVAATTWTDDEEGADPDGYDILADAPDAAAARSIFLQDLTVVQAAVLEGQQERTLTKMSLPRRKRDGAIKEPPRGSEEKLVLTVQLRLWVYSNQQQVCSMTETSLKRTLEQVTCEVTRLFREEAAVLPDHSNGSPPVVLPAQARAGCSILQREDERDAAKSNTAKVFSPSLSAGHRRSRPCATRLPPSPVRLIAAWSS